MGIPARRFDLNVSDDELAYRQAEWRSSQKALAGWLKRYTVMVASGSQGRYWLREKGPEGFLKFFEAFAKVQPPVPLTRPRAPAGRS